MAKRKAKTGKEIRRKHNKFSRKQNNRSIRKLFLIVCEGEKTEPLYFESLKRSLKLKPNVCQIEGMGMHTVGLVQAAIDLSKKGSFDQVWVVMDRDSFTPEQFNNALQLAKQKKIQVAYSNEAFELWYLLHFDFHQSALSRKSYKERLSNRLGRPYTKNDPTMFVTLEAKLSDAIRNAKRLIDGYGQSHSPFKDNPSTTVHHLVEELQKHGN